ncbi:MAG: hypothetical protein K2I73_04080 [Eubacterium sp.]|nr:hypothetical protein [Eubacterium sp.]
MNKKVLSIIGLVLGAITVIVAFMAGLSWDWGVIGLFAGLGIIVSNLSGVIKPKEQNNQPTDNQIQG